MTFTPTNGPSSGTALSVKRYMLKMNVNRQSGIRIFNQPIKNKNMKKITIFRLLVLTLIVCNFLASYKLDSEAAVLIMLWNIIFTIAFIMAEAVHAFDEAK